MKTNKKREPSRTDAEVVLTEQLRTLGEQVRNRYLSPEAVLNALLLGDRKKQAQIEQIEALYCHFRNVLRYGHQRQATYILITMLQIGSKLQLDKS